MYYVYLIEGREGARYVGSTSELKRRLAQHNAGESAHTRKYVPWSLVSYVAFADEAGLSSSRSISSKGPGMPLLDVTSGQAAPTEAEAFELSLQQGLPCVASAEQGGRSIVVML